MNPADRQPAPDNALAGGPTSSSGYSRRRLTNLVGPTVGAIGVLGLWQLCMTLFRVPTYLIPAPTAVWAALVANIGLLGQNALPTLFEAMAGFVVGNLVAILLATIFVHSQPLENTFYPMAVIVRSIPVVAVAPVVIILFGEGYTSKIVVAALVCFFPTLVNMVRGLGSVDSQALELMRVLSASKSEVFFKLRLVNSLPFLFAALKIATGASVLGAIVAEWIGAQVGLGVLIITATFDFRTPLLYATLVVASGVALIFFWLVSLVERLVVRWESDDLAV